MTPPQAGSGRPTARPACAHFGTCGGCSLQDRSYPDQLALKARRLTAALAGARRPSAAGRAARLPDVDVVGIPVDADGMPWRFRQKAAFVFGAPARGRGLVMGHYARGSKRVVPVEACPVHSERANRIAFALRDRLARAGLTAFGADRDGVLRHVIVRVTADEREAVAMLVVAGNIKALRTPVRGLLASDDRPDGFLLNEHAAPGPYMVGPDTTVIDGRRHVRETVAGLSFLVSPTAFFQTNVRAAGELVRLVLDAVGDAPRVLDLFCGSGLFALPLAARGARVAAIEENRDAVRDLEANIRLNRLPEGRVLVLGGRVEDRWPRVRRETWDAVVVDPPRDGLGDRVLASVFRELAPPRVVYVSCNPDALARELPAIGDAGYALTRAHLVDMFPHTEHIEAVVQFDRVPA